MNAMRNYETHTNLQTENFVDSDLIRRFESVSI